MYLPDLIIVKVTSYYYTIKVICRVSLSSNHLNQQPTIMKVITLTPQEFYVFKALANQHGEPFVQEPYRAGDVVVTVSALFCTAWGYE